MAQKENKEKKNNTMLFGSRYAQENSLATTGMHSTDLITEIESYVQLGAAEICHGRTVLDPKAEQSADEKDYVMESSVAQIECCACTKSIMKGVTHYLRERPHVITLWRAEDSRPALVGACCCAEVSTPASTKAPITAAPGNALRRYTSACASHAKHK